MERPFEDDRPVGPFVGQSSNFRDKFLGGGIKEETFKPGQEGAIVISPTEDTFNSHSSPIGDVITTVENKLSEAVELKIEFEGLLDCSHGGNRQLVALTYVVGDVNDRDVTIGQYEEALRKQLVAYEHGVSDVTIHNSETTLSA